MNPIPLFKQEIIHINSHGKCEKDKTGSRSLTLNLDSSENNTEHFKLLALKHVTFEHNYPNVSEYDNKLYLEHNSQVYTLEFTPKQYTNTSFITEFAIACTNASVPGGLSLTETSDHMYTINTTSSTSLTYKFLRFKEDASEIDKHGGIYDIMGFTDDDTTITISSASPYTITHVYNFRGPTHFYLGMDMGTEGHVKSNIGVIKNKRKRQLEMHHIFYIPCHVTYGDTVHYESPDVYSKQITGIYSQGNRGALLSSELHFYLYDHKQRLLRLNNQTNLSISFLKYYNN